MTGKRRAVEITRVLDATRAAVFSMWTDPEKLARWWGLEEEMIVLCEIDPRRGGAIKIDERQPDGSIHQMTGTVEKVVTPELLVFTIASPGIRGYPPWENLNTVTFEALLPKRTRVKVAVKLLKAPPEKTEVLDQAFKSGWAEQFDRLQRALE